MKAAAFEKVSTDEFLQDHEFEALLRQRNTSEFKDFRNRCLEIMDYLVGKVLSHLVVSAGFMQGLYCFCPELLLEGYDHHVFCLFKTLLQVLERTGPVSSCESKAAAQELVTYVVDLRARTLVVVVVLRTFVTSHEICYCRCGSGLQCCAADCCDVMYLKGSELCFGCQIQTRILLHATYDREYSECLCRCQWFHVVVIF